MVTIRNNSTFTLGVLTIKQNPLKNIFNKSQKISKMRKKYIREISNLIQGNSKVGQMFLHESYLDIFLLLLKAIGDWIAIQYMFRDRLLM